MNETAWLTSNDPQLMLEEACRHGASNRKLRLFSCACYLMRGESVATVDEYERIGPETDWSDADWATSWNEAGSVKPPHLSERASLLRDIFGNPFRPVRCLFRHPYAEQGAAPCSVTRSCADCNGALAWNDCTVPRMAQSIYDRRAFDQMPELADALEEAGCTNEEILMHCRGHETCPECLGTGRVKQSLTDALCDLCLMTSQWIDASGSPYCVGCGFICLRGPHVRGCWVLDLLLGKS